jgi:hypothetical protein
MQFNAEYTNIHVREYGVMSETERGVMSQTERTSGGNGAWPWRDGGAWITDVRAALRAWLQVPFCFAHHTNTNTPTHTITRVWQEHKRELGFLGQRQLEQAAAACSCSTYVATQRPAATGYPWLCINPRHVECKKRMKKLYYES